MLFKNRAQKVSVYAFDATTGLPKTGDAANITVYYQKDDGSVTGLTDTSAAEKDATNAKGQYDFDITAAECNADKLTITGKSSTANVVVMPVTILTNDPRRNGVLDWGTLQAIGATTATIRAAAAFGTNKLVGTTLVMLEDGSRTIITANDASDGITFAGGWTGATPSAGEYAIIGSPSGGAALTAADIWDLTTTGHGTSGTFGGLFAGITVIAQWLGLIAGKQSGNATARTELRATGAGSGTYDETADSLEALEARQLTALLKTRLEEHLGGVAKIIFTSGSSATNLLLNATTGVNGAAPSSTNDFYNGGVLIFLTGALALQKTPVTDYVGSTKALTVPALTSAPASGDMAILV